MFPMNGYAHLHQNFTIENNIIKGIEETYDVKEKSVGKIILKSFNENLNNIGQIDADTGKRTSFAEMKENSIRCALWMRKQGIKNGDIVGLSTHNQLDAYIPFVATFFVGAVLNPWYHEHTLQSARHFMKLTKPKLMFACESILNVLKEAAKCENVDVKFIVFGKDLKTQSLKDIMTLQTKEEVNNFQAKETDDPKDFALIMFSSGTTGLPKAVVHSYRALRNNISKFATDSNKNLVTLSYSSLYWISGTLITFQTLLTAGTKIFHGMFDPDETCKTIQKFKVDIVFLNTGILSYFCRSDVLKKYDLTSIKLFIVGGARLSLEVGEEFNKNFHIPVTQGYGLTELGALVALQSSSSKQIESTGFVVANIQLKVIDLASKEPLGPNRNGEICLRAPTIMMVGYYNNEAATREILDDEGWLHTGDIGYYSEEGEIFIVDRIKEIMKVRGHHISPSEIESVILSHPGIIEAAVVPVPHKMDIEVPMAFVKAVPEIKVTEIDLVRLSSELGEFKKITGGVKFLEEMPHTASGKVDRKKLKEMAKVYAVY